MIDRAIERRGLVTVDGEFFAMTQKLLDGDLVRADGKSPAKPAAREAPLPGPEVPFPVRLPSGANRS